MIGVGIQSKTPDAGVKLGFPLVATKNTTRVAGSDPVADAAGVALAVFPSQVPGTHPSAVTLAPTDDWQAAIAASALMAPADPRAGAAIRKLVAAVGYQRRPEDSWRRAARAWWRAHR